MRDIHCPKDIGFENTFYEEDCKREQFYNNCYHCWSTAIAKEKANWIMSILDKIKSEIEEQVLESLSDGGDDWFAAEKVNECLGIIDKYKAESEG